jgi:hypothetical protein
LSLYFLKRIKSAIQNYVFGKEHQMIETKLNSRMIAAQERAHQERADAFVRLFHRIPQLVSSMRIGGKPKG